MTSRLPPLPTLRDIIRMYGLTAKQQLSQNFIMDLNLTDKIIQRTQKRTGPLFGKTVIEVGPGPGSLTRSILAERPKNLVLIEKDLRFKSAMEMLKDAATDTNVHVVYEDVLNVDENKLLTEVGATKKQWEEQAEVVILGNLPFSVSTELLLKWIRQIHYKEGAFAFGRAGMCLTFQKEVGHRIVSRPCSKDYNRLSVMVQHNCNATLLFDIGPKNFVPQPKVSASVVYVEPLLKPVGEVDIKALEQLCRLVFGTKRKVMSNGIKNVDLAGGALLDLSGIDPTKRPEEISVRDWCLLSNVYKHSIFYQSSLDQRINIMDE
eukprot:TRINITY_DN2648_c0_g1_i8.p1 TRINITY_DN2648_c0_g1~~TRINITY_DN2648_c0_g1_i8.p1  ORF type:complete len:320 (-),score=41.42 TRINITY_DN2648_c0_g1_i8:23-982(-)